MVCGTDHNLEFDHIDPSTKVAQVSSPKLLDGPLEAFLHEVDKCQLLCKKHHVEKTRLNGDPTGGGHNKIDNYTHGTGAYYGKGCRCVLCVEWKVDYRRGAKNYAGDLI